MAAGLGVIATLSLLAYLFSDVHPTLEKFGILNPLCICVFFVIYLLNPLHIFHFKARRWVLRILVSVAFTFFLQLNMCVRITYLLLTILNM